jgi:hypothetical protein
MRVHADHWLVRETLGLLRRTFARLDVSARSLYAVIAPGSCFAGLLFELALEERASLSPDALTAMEANLRFPGAETAETKLFARLSAWQNWVFNRPNATGALKRFGGGSKPRFDWERV